MKEHIIWQIENLINQKTIFYSNSNGFYMIENDFVFSFESFYDKIFLNLRKDREELTIEVEPQQIHNILKQYIEHQNKAFNKLPQKLQKPVIDYLINNSYDIDKIKNGLTHINPQLGIYFRRDSVKDIHSLSLIQVRFFDLNRDNCHSFSILGLDAYKYKFLQNDVFKIKQLTHRLLFIEDIPQLTHLFNLRAIQERQLLIDLVDKKEEGRGFKI